MKKPQNLHELSKKLLVSRKVYKKDNDGNYEESDVVRDVYDVVKDNFTPAATIYFDNNYNTLQKLSKLEADRLPSEKNNLAATLLKGRLRYVKDTKEHAKLSKEIVATYNGADTSEMGYLNKSLEAISFVIEDGGNKYTKLEDFDVPFADISVLITAVIHFLSSRGVILP